MTKTTELGVQSVLYLAQHPEGYLANPQEIAERMGESSAYIAKVLRLMTHSGIIRSHRGVSGGFELVRKPEDITLLEIVEACQGTIQGNYCREMPASVVPQLCGYHQAMFELKETCRRVLSEWTVARILKNPEARVPSPACRFRRIRVAATLSV